MATVKNLGITANNSSGEKSLIKNDVHAGDLPIIITAHNSNTSANTPTDNNLDGMGTYSSIGNCGKNSSGDTMTAWVRDHLIGNTVATKFTHVPGTSSGGLICVGIVQGMSKYGTSAVRSFGSQSNQTGTPAPVMNNSALSTNPVISAVFNGSSPPNVAIPSGYTVGGVAAFASPNTGYKSAFKSSGETSDTITWGSSPSEFCSLAVEFDGS